MKNKYRIITDKYAGYEVQIKRWWFPFMYFECWQSRDMFLWANTFVSIRHAREFIDRHKYGLLKIPKKSVKISNVVYEE